MSEAQHSCHSSSFLSGLKIPKQLLLFSVLQADLSVNGLDSPILIIPTPLLAWLHRPMSGSDTCWLSRCPGEPPSTRFFLFFFLKSLESLPKG